MTFFLNEQFYFFLQEIHIAESGLVVFQTNLGIVFNKEFVGQTAKIRWAQNINFSKF